MLLAAVAALTASNIQTRRNERRAVTESAKAVATSNLLLAMLDSASPEQAKGSEYTVRQLLDDFSAGLGDQLRDQREAEAAVRLTIGNAYRRLNLFQKAQPHLEKALQLRRELFGDDHEMVAESQVALAWNFSAWSAAFSLLSIQSAAAFLVLSGLNKVLVMSEKPSNSALDAFSLSSIVLTPLW
jgi:tetratricopeptide (TPR) repeat protein